MMRKCISVHTCVFIMKDKRSASLESSVFLLPLPLTSERVDADCSAPFIMETPAHSLTSSTCDRTGAPAWSIRQRLNPAFPLGNCTLIPDSLHQLQECTLERFLGKSKLSLKRCLTPAVRFLSPVMTLFFSSTAVPNHALL